MRTSSFALVLDTPVHVTEVSSVFGKQFSNSRKRSGSRMVLFICSMISSTSGMTTLRQDGSGLW